MALLAGKEKPMQLLCHFTVKLLQVSGTCFKNPSSFLFNLCQLLNHAACNKIFLFSKSENSCNF